MRAEFRIDGANCPTCLNATVDALRALPTVRSVWTSSVASCLAIDHDETDSERLVEVIRANLHSIEMYGAEIMMVSVDPLVAELHCRHGGH